MVELHPNMPDPRPAKRGFLEPLGKEANTAAIPKAYSRPDALLTHGAAFPLTTKMHCVKLLGQRLAARDFDRQVAEFQVRVAVLNGFTALGTPVT